MSAVSQYGLPDGAVVCLRTITPLGVPLYMSTVGDSVATHGVGTYATLRPHRQDWEAFRVRLFDDGTAALQNAGGGYLSPENKDAKRWTFRAHCPAGGWERLTLTPTRPAHGEISNTYPSHFSITTRINGETLILSRGDTATDSGADTEVVITTTAQHQGGQYDSPCNQWEVILCALPVVNFMAFGGVPALSAELAHVRCVVELTGKAQEFVWVILRAMLEIGAFYVVGHGVADDLFASIQTKTGRLPYKDDAEAEDGSFKVNTSLLERRSGHYTVGTADGIACGNREMWDAMVRGTFAATETVADTLLHALAHGQEIVTGSPAPWRSKWADKDHYIGFRCLVYHPGPLRKANDHPVVTTARHTDATWVTVLRNDSVGGLAVKPPAFGEWLNIHPVEGALLVNTGNVMATATAGLLAAGTKPLFGAVCHYVERVSSTATRVSMPFFYDRNGGASYDGGGTGGC